jgi:hypothetical protein
MTAKRRPFGSSPEEVFATSEKFDLGGYILDCVPGDQMAAEMCESLKERHPTKPIFAVTTISATNGNAPKFADYVVLGNNPEELLKAIIAVFGVQSASMSG